jgi:O-antigen ligase
MEKVARVDIRFLFLIGLLIFLPSIESLKNIFAFLFVVSWVVIAKKNNDWGGKWLIIDSIFLLWILTAIFVSINAIITFQLPGDGVSDIIRFVLIGWLVSRTNFSKERLAQSALVAVVAVIASLMYSYYSGHGELEELNSVGHINHTAIYITITYAISLALLLFNYRNLNSCQKITLVVTTMILFFTIIDAGSAAGYGLLFIITLLYFLYLLIRVKKLSLVLGAFVAVTCIGILLAQQNPDAVKKIQNRIPIYNENIDLIFSINRDNHLAIDYEYLGQISHNFFNHGTRERINEFSYYAFKTNPLFGVGFGNYSQITMDDIRESVLKSNEIFDVYLYQTSSHPHSVYYTYLVSGGLLVFSIFVWFWFYIVWVIIKHVVLNRLRIYRNKFPENEWIVLSSISVVLVNLVIGMVNTTLHHEHAILSMFVLGLLIAQFRRTELIEELTE